MAGTEVAVIFVELAGGGVKVSFRSRGSVDCSRLAEGFSRRRTQGGGRRHDPRTRWTAAQAKVLDAVRKAMR